MKQLTPNVFGILTTLNGLNGYLIINGDELTLVDAGIKGFSRSVQKALTLLHRNMSDIKRIVITHAHPDHVGDLPAIQQATNATTYAHRLDAPVVRGDWPMAYPKPEDLGAFSRFMLARMKGTALPVSRVEVEVEDGQVLDEILPGTQVVHLPGHSHGQIGLYLPTEKTLIGGDVAMKMPWGLIKPLRPASPDWDAVSQSIKKAAGLPIENLMLGHGTPIIGGAQQALQAFVTKI